MHPLLLLPLLLVPLLLLPLLLVPRLAAKENLTSRLARMLVGTKTANTFQLLSVGFLSNKKSLFKPL
jgi:hypothetical protein